MEFEFERRPLRPERRPRSPLPQPWLRLPSPPPKRHPHYTEERETYIECPYDFAHYIAQSKFSEHLERCRSEYRSDMKARNKPVDMVGCRFNWVHQVPRPEIRTHEQTCPDQNKITQTYISSKSKFSEHLESYRSDTKARNEPVEMVGSRSNINHVPRPEIRRHEQSCSDLDNITLNNVSSKLKFSEDFGGCKSDYRIDMKARDRPVEVVSCRFNRVHQVARPEIRRHEQSCPDQDKITPTDSSSQYYIRPDAESRDRMKSRSPPPNYSLRMPYNQRRGNQNNSKYTKYSAPPPVAEEDWDLCTTETPTYDPNMKPSDIILKPPVSKQRPRRGGFHFNTKSRFPRRQFRGGNRQRVDDAKEYEGHREKVPRPPQKKSRRSYSPSSDADKDLEEYGVLTTRPEGRTVSNRTTFYDPEHPEMEYLNESLEYYEGPHRSEFSRRDRNSSYCRPDRSYEDYGPNYSVESQSPDSSPGCFYYRRDGQDQSEWYHSDHESVWDIGEATPKGLRSPSSSSKSFKNALRRGNSETETVTSSPATTEGANKARTDSDKEQEIICFDWDGDEPL